MHAMIRFPPKHGGHPAQRLDIIIVNDTGSNVQTVLPEDLQTIGCDYSTYPDRSKVLIDTPNGPCWRNHVRLEMQIVKEDGTPMTEWYKERCVVGSDPRLSGLGMRQHLYFATAPGNHALYVAQKKNGIVEQLPRV